MRKAMCFESEPYAFDANATCLVKELCAFEFKEIPFHFLRQGSLA